MEKKEKKIKGITVFLGVLAFVASFVLAAQGILQESTVYYVVKDTMKYGGIIVIALIIAAIISLKTVKEALKQCSAGVELAFVMIVMVIWFFIAMALIIPALLLLVDIVGCEAGWFARTGFDLSDAAFAEKMSRQIGLYRAVFSGAVAVSVMLIYNVSRVIVRRITSGEYV